MPCYVAHNKNEKFQKSKKKPTKYVRNRKRKNLKESQISFSANQAKVKCHFRPHRQKLNFIFFGHTGKKQTSFSATQEKVKLHSRPHRQKLNFILGHTGKKQTSLFAPQAKNKLHSPPHRQKLNFILRPTGKS